MQVPQFCNKAEKTYIFQMELKESFRFFLKPINEKYLAILPKIHLTETQTSDILRLKIHCDREKLLPLKLMLCFHCAFFPLLI